MTFELAPEPIFAKRWVRESALAQYLFSHRRFDPAKLVARVRDFFGTANEKSGAWGPLEAAGLHRTGIIIETFLEALRKRADVRIALAIDTNHHALARGESVAEPERDRLIERCRTAGLTVIDLTHEFAQHFKTSRPPLEVGPNDGHWNPIATRIVANAIVKAGAWK